MESIKNRLRQSDFQKKYQLKKCYLFSANKLPIELDKLSAEVFSDMQSMIEDDYFLTKLLQKKESWEINTSSFKLPDIGDKAPWTFLAHNLDKYNLHLFDLLKEFDIFPNWALDDIMGSFSTQNSITPAHIDSYDVFLLQISGRRKWDMQYDANQEYEENQPLRILKDFKSEQTIELGPGDMLYVPSGVAHQATTLETGLSLSIGIQSLNTADVLLQIASMEELTPSFYRPPMTSSSSFLIDQSSLHEIKSKIVDSYINSEVLDNSLLVHLNRFQSDEQSDESHLSYSAFSEKFQKSVLFRSELSKFSALKMGNRFKTAIGDEIVELNEDQVKKLTDIFSQNLEYEISYELYSDLTKILYKYFQVEVIFFNED